MKLKQAAFQYLQYMEANKPNSVHTHPVMGDEIVATCPACAVHALGMRLRRAIEEEYDSAPADWIAATRAVLWGRWRWPTEPFVEVQRWGDRNGCRFILVSELNEDAEVAYNLFLYVAPKPNRRATGLCEHSIANRDRGLAQFDAFLEGFLAGRGLLFPGESVR